MTHRWWQGINVGAAEKVRGWGYPNTVDTRNTGRKPLSLEFNDSAAAFVCRCLVYDKNLNTSNFGAYVGRKSRFEISSRPCLTNDLALRPCFKILIGLTYMSLCSPTRYAHTRAMRTIASRRCGTHSVTRVGALDVKARRFHGTECRFNLPALFIGRDSVFRPFETGQDLKFGYPVGVLGSTSGEMDILSFVQKGSWRNFSGPALRELKSRHALILSPVEGLATQISCRIRT